MPFCMYIRNKLFGINNDFAFNRGNCLHSVVFFAFVLVICRRAHDRSAVEKTHETHDLHRMISMVFKIQSQYENFNKTLLLAMPLASHVHE